VYWCAARLQPRREALALHVLGLNGYATYLTRLRQQRRQHGRKIETRPPLFPGYAFVAIELQWHTARWAAGVIGLIMDGMQPARVPDGVIAEIRSRERNGLIELPQPRGLRRGDGVRIIGGPFSGRLAIFATMKPRERVEALLAMLGGERAVTLRKRDVETVRPVP
jgi:transcriptional antiterminator RfaH